MKRISVSIEKKALITVGTVKKEYQWGKLGRVTICRLDPVLCDEVSIVFDTENGQFFVEEVDSGFWELLKAINIDSHLPQDWYTKAEQGHVFTAQLNNI